MTKPVHVPSGALRRQIEELLARLCAEHDIAPVPTIPIFIFRSLRRALTARADIILSPVKIHRFVSVSVAGSAAWPVT